MNDLCRLLRFLSIKRISDFSGLLSLFFFVCFLAEICLSTWHLLITRIDLCVENRGSQISAFGSSPFGLQRAACRGAFNNQTVTRDLNALTRTAFQIALFKSKSLTVWCSFSATHRKLSAIYLERSGQWSSTGGWSEWNAMLLHEMAESRSSEKLVSLLKLSSWKHFAGQ